MTLQAGCPVSLSEVAIACPWRPSLAAGPWLSPTKPRDVPKRLSLAIAAIPALALTFAIPLVNRDDPHVLGLPFILAWIVAWVLLVPVFLWIVHTKVERRR